ncbi:MAG: glucosaminidase domain-containing protein [Treponema sp.]|jgi:hypothetical protein|nr:glucosaminidase domain-containing protein [Treponema sp.]
MSHRRPAEPEIPERPFKAEPEHRGAAEQSPERPETPEQPPETPEWPIPEIPLYILGTGRVAPETLSSFLLFVNPGAGEEFSSELARFYAEESEIEGVNHDVAFAQMCLETGFLRYGNLITADMNNFCGLGAIGIEQRGERFAEPRIGVRAHIQHLKAYATEEPPKQEVVDPRYRWVRYGSAPTIYGLTGTWAMDREYAEKIKSILEMLYQFVYANPV